MPAGQSLGVHVTAALRDVVICEPLRTPVGGYGGVFRDVPAAELAAAVIRALLARTGLEPGVIDDVIFGQCYPNGEAPAIGRVAALDAGLPVEVPGIQLDRRCGSGLQAVLNAAMQVQTGVSDVVLAGGAESMSQAEYYSPDVRWGARGGQAGLHDRLARGRVTAGGIHHPVPGGMLETAENLRREYAHHRGRSRTSWRSARTSEGRRGAGGRPVRRGDRPGDRAHPQGRDGGGHRRAPAGRHHAGEAGRAAPGARQERPAGHGDRGQRQRAERRRRGLRGHLPGAGRRAWACGRSAAWSAGRSPASRRKRWASARFPPPPGRWPAPG